MNDWTVFQFAKDFDNKGAKLCGNTWIDSKASNTGMFEYNKITMKIEKEYCFCGVGKALSSSKTCDNCLSGKYQSQNGFTGACESCDPGLYSVVVLSETADDCQECPIGWSQAIPGTPFCESCQPGTIQTLEGQSKCLDCNEGQYRPRQIQVNDVMTDTELTKCK